MNNISSYLHITYKNARFNIDTLYIRYYLIYSCRYALRIRRHIRSCLEAPR